jgi:hypothetical protein
MSEHLTTHEVKNEYSLTSISGISIHNVVTRTAIPPCTPPPPFFPHKSRRTHYPYPVCNTQCATGPYYTFIMYGAMRELCPCCRGRLFMKSGVDSVCDAIHIRHDILSSRREKSDVSTAEATIALLRIIDDCVST